MSKKTESIVIYFLNEYVAAKKLLPFHGVNDMRTEEHDRVTNTEFKSDVTSI